VRTVTKASRYFDFFAAGIPATKGSTRSFALKKGGVYTGRVATTNDSRRTKPWMGVVAAAAHAAGVECHRGAVEVSCAFYLPRPKAHFGSGRNAERLRESAPRLPTNGRADLDKMVRCVLDALLGIAYVDDGQVARLEASKFFSPENGQHGARVVIRRMELLTL
jgi:Holliday junction resolvase RusA-like endonuclease